jgi:hypothetical protein
MVVIPFEPTSTEPGATPVESTNKYELYREDVNPCRWYLAVNGSEPLRIAPGELSSQPRFRNWHFDHGLKPPNSTERYKFENMICRLYDTAIKYEKTLPFLETDAGIVENLVFFLDMHIPTLFRAKGMEFMKGKIGDTVRVRDDYGRVYFKWKPMKRFWLRNLSAREAEVEMLKMFITERGGYQGEGEGRDWFRCSYWLPLDLFDEETKTRWFGAEDK